MPFNVPNRTSDAGPEASAPINRQALYSLLMDEAHEALRDLERIYRDNRATERKLRVEKIAEISEALVKLQEVA